MVMGNSKNSHVFNFAILLKSRKFDAREILMFYSMIDQRHFKQPKSHNIKKAVQNGC